MSDRLGDMPLTTLLNATAAKAPTPGGGAVASITGALAAALAQMVVAYSKGKKALAQHEPLLAEADRVLTNARALLLSLADEDAQAYGLVNELSRLPESDPRRADLPEAQRASVQVPMAVLAACVDLLRLQARLAGRTNHHLRSDLAIAAILTDAGARAAWWNVLVNAPALPDAGQSTLAHARAMLADAARISAAVQDQCGGGV